jgi:sugar O-acyltransferase (sialic acid O-acetyltransferase NeuD family)
MKKVVIFGIGDLGQLACIYLRKDSPHEVAAFTVNQQFLPAGKVLDCDVVPFETIEQTHPASDYRMFVAVGYKRMNRARQEIYDACKAKGYELISYVNSRACCMGTLGDNCFVFEQNVIQPFVKIGNNVILWSGNHVGHHAQIDDHCFIASHAVISGHVHIGAHSFVGVNATFKDGVKVPDSTKASRVKASQLRSFR